MLISNRDCADIHAIYAQSDRNAIVRGFYFNSWLGGGYRNFMPRSVMVEYMKLLLSFHLGLYHLRLLKLLPAWERQRKADALCTVASCPVKPREAQAPQGD